MYTKFLPECIIKQNKLFQDYVYTIIQNLATQQLYHMAILDNYLQYLLVIFPNTVVFDIVNWYDQIRKAYGIKHHWEHLCGIWISVWIENVHVMNIYEYICFTIVFVISKHTFIYNIKIQFANDFHCCVFSQYRDGLVQDCINSSASTLDLLQSCSKPSIDGILRLHFSLRVNGSDLAIRARIVRISGWSIQ